MRECEPQPSSASYGLYMRGGSYSTYLTFTGTEPEAIAWAVQTAAHRSQRWEAPVRMRLKRCCTLVIAMQMEPIVPERCPECGAEQPMDEW